MAVPYTFGTATASIPLSQLDSNFATVITLGNTAIQLGNTVTTLNNMTLANVTISSGNITLTNVSATTANVTTANVVTMIITGNETVQGNTTVTGTITGAKLIPTGSSVTGNGMYLPATNSVGISTNGTNAVYIDASQNVGIGTSSPSYKLDVVGTGDLANRVSTTGTSNAASIILQSGSGTTSGLFAYARFLNNDTNAQDWRIGTYGTNNLSIVNAKAGTVPVTVDTSGNVGIGASTLTAKLTINGNTIAYGSAPYYALGATYNDTTAYLQYTASTKQLNIQCADGTTGGFTTFGTGNGNERMRIDASGNVGIGTSAPSSSAILDAQSTTKGVRMPNMTTTQKNAISSPAAGLMVFDTTLAKLCVYSGSAWQTITSI